ncbi:MAG: AAA family ATPase [Erysipelotrichaceae bacterium]|nr:AAA family ATPase [Erysipelotrichaceae bacterium]
MLKRKIENFINSYLDSGDQKILLINGARQIGKSTSICNVCEKRYKNFIHLDMIEDKINYHNFVNVKSTEDFYLRLGMIAGEKLGDKKDTMIFIDEIQEYPNLLTLLKFLKQEGRFNYIVSGSRLGITLFETTSVPAGAILTKKMYPMDFEEFLWANGVNDEAIGMIEMKLKNGISLEESEHNRMLDLFKKYLLIGGLPAAVDTYVKTKNIVLVRSIHDDVYSTYENDAAKYDFENKLNIKRIYGLMTSYLENKSKRVTIKDIKEKEHDRFSNYEREFAYLVHSGIAIDVNAVANPKYPLKVSEKKNLLKLYFNDVGILSNLLFRNNIMAILDNDNGVNLGTVYENAVACELRSHHDKDDIYYYDNKTKGEIDFLVDDFDNLNILPIEVKSGKDYKVHSAISSVIKNKEYGVKKGLVLSNSRVIEENNGVKYYPVYYSMFI